MRVLHTADWHLGAVLKQVQRLPDQLGRVEEVLTICDKRQRERHEPPGKPVHGLGEDSLFPG